MTLDDASKIAQIVFYATIAILTILTFLRAKKGLLNTVNTEYHKKVIERLDDLSKTLHEEYDWDSPNHWSKKDPIGKIVKSINKQFTENKEQIVKAGRFYGIPSHPDYQRLISNLQRVKSDPFIPRTIRTKVADLLENRANVTIEVYIQEIERYQDGLVKGKYTEKLDDNAGWVHNHILSELRKRGCGIEQIEKEVHEIRLSIQTYFERFDPEN